jgi:hypothetical protein
MSKRAILKSIAFLCGLYFFLEFVLPGKIGGDFDAAAVHSPVLVETPGGPVILYVGQYDDASASLGRLVAPEERDRPWSREPDEPVLQRTLFVPYERNGMRQLDAVSGPNGIDLFYLGLDRELKLTLCHAVGDPTGREWRRTGAVTFTIDSGAPRPTVSEPNGELPGALRFFAVEGGPGQWTLLLALQRADGRHEVRVAEGASLDGLRLAPTPLLAAEAFPSGVTAFEGWRTDAGWVLDFVQGEAGVRLAQAEDGTFRRQELPLPTDGAAVTGLRRNPAGDAYRAGSGKGAAVGRDHSRAVACAGRGSVGSDTACEADRAGGLRAPAVGVDAGSRELPADYRRLCRLHCADQLDDVSWQAGRAPSERRVPQSCFFLGLGGDGGFYLRRAG